MVDTSDVGAVILRRIREEMGLEASAYLAEALAPQLRELAYLQHAAMRYEADPHFEEAMIVAHEHVEATWRARLAASEARVAEAEERVASRILGHLEEMSIEVGLPYVWTVELDEPPDPHTLTPDQLDDPAVVKTRRVRRALPRENLAQMFQMLEDKLRASRPWSLLDTQRGIAREARARQDALATAADEIALMLREVAHLPAASAEEVRAWARSCYDDACQRLNGDILRHVGHTSDRHEEIARLRQENTALRADLARHTRREGTIYESLAELHKMNGEHGERLRRAGDFLRRTAARVERVLDGLGV